VIHIVNTRCLLFIIISRSSNEEIKATLIKQSDRIFHYLNLYPFPGWYLCVDVGCIADVSDIPSLHLHGEVTNYPTDSLLYWTDHLSVGTVTRAVPTDLWTCLHRQCPVGSNFTYKIQTVSLTETSVMQPTYTRCQNPQTVSILFTRLLNYPSRITARI
jgi:hypothetical protein